MEQICKSRKEYELIKDGDKVMVCISGGKDSFLLAKCIEELKNMAKLNSMLNMFV